MAGNRFTEEHVIQILQEADPELSVADICWKNTCWQ